MWLVCVVCLGGCDKTMVRVKKKRSWRKDGSGTRRYPVAEAERRARCIRNKGMPCNIQYDVRPSGLVNIKISPRKGFVHLSTPYDVKYCRIHCGQYHISIAKKKVHELHPDSNLQVALAKIRRALAKPKRTTLRISWVNPATSVAHVHKDDENFKKFLPSMLLMRSIFAAHDGPDLTISL